MLSAKGFDGLCGCVCSVSGESKREGGARRALIDQKIRKNTVNLNMHVAFGEFGLGMNHKKLHNCFYTSYVFILTINTIQFNFAR